MADGTNVNVHADYYPASRPELSGGKSAGGRLIIGMNVDVRAIRAPVSTNSQPASGKESTDVAYRVSTHQPIYNLTALRLQISPSTSFNSIFKKNN